MNIAELHSILYPMAKPYEGPEDSFAFSFDGEFEVKFHLLESDAWQYSRLERGQLQESFELPSKEAACEQLLEDFGRTSCPYVPDA